jgi:hypothetical protein
VPAVPLAERLRVLGLEEHTADAGDSFHEWSTVLRHATH